MDQSILDAIAKALPAMQMDALREELRKASEHKAMKDALIKYEFDKSQKQQSIDVLEKKLKEHEALDIKMAALETKDRNIEIEMLKLKVSCAEEKYAAVKDLAYAAFRNPTVQKSFNRHVGIPSGGYQNVVSESETQTVE